MIDVICKEVVPALQNYLVSNKDASILKHWNLLVQLLGKHLHSGASKITIFVTAFALHNTSFILSELINTMMVIVEKAFKQDSDVIREAAFRSWMVLMDNFSLSKQVLTSAKRVKLLTRPLTVGF